MNVEVRRKGLGPRHTMADVLAHFKRLGHAPQVIVDVGVGHGTPALYDAFPDAYLLLVEPLVGEFEHPVAEVLERRSGHWVQAAAAAESGTTTIEVHTATVLSSTRSVGGIPREVPVITIDEALTHADVPDGPLILKVDVEGAELEVIAGATAALERAEVLLLEVALFELAPGVPLFHEVIATMAEAGWVAHDFYDGGLRPLDDSLGRIDVAFVRRDGPFHADQRYATDEQLERLYTSWGY